MCSQVAISRAVWVRPQGSNLGFDSALYEVHSGDIFPNLPKLMGMRSSSSIDKLTSIERCVILLSLYLYSHDILVTCQGFTANRYRT